MGIVKRKELLNSKGYWLAQTQVIIWETVSQYLNIKHISPSEFATLAGISLYKVRKILKGDWSGSMVEYIQVMIACKKAVKIQVEELNKQK